MTDKGNNKQVESVEDLQISFEEREAYTARVKMLNEFGITPNSLEKFLTNRRAYQAEAEKIGINPHPIQPRFVPLSTLEEFEMAELDEETRSRMSFFQTSTVKSLNIPGRLEHQPSQENDLDAREHNFHHTTGSTSTPENQ